MRADAAGNCHIGPWSTANEGIEAGAMVSLGRPAGSLARELAHQHSTSGVTPGGAPGASPAGPVPGTAGRVGGRRPLSFRGLLACQFGDSEEAPVALGTAHFRAAAPGRNDAKLTAYNRVLTGDSSVRSATFLEVSRRGTMTGSSTAPLGPALPRDSNDAMGRASNVVGSCGGREVSSGGLFVGTSIISEGDYEKKSKHDAIALARSMADPLARVAEHVGPDNERGAIEVRTVSHNGPVRSLESLSGSGPLRFVVAAPTERLRTTPHKERKAVGENSTENLSEPESQALDVAAAALRRRYVSPKRPAVAPAACSTRSSGTTGGSPSSEGSSRVRVAPASQPLPSSRFGRCSSEDEPDSLIATNRSGGATSQLEREIETIEPHSRRCRSGSEEKSPVHLAPWSRSKSRILCSPPRGELSSRNDLVQNAKLRPAVSRSVVPTSGLACLRHEGQGICVRELLDSLLYSCSGKAAWWFEAECTPTPSGSSNGAGSKSDGNFGTTIASRTRFGTHIQSHPNSRGASRQGDPKGDKGYDGPGVGSGGCLELPAESEDALLPGRTGPTYWDLGYSVSPVPKRLHLKRGRLFDSSGREARGQLGGNSKAVSPEVISIAGPPTGKDEQFENIESPVTTAHPRASQRLTRLASSKVNTLQESKLTSRVWIPGEALEHRGGNESSLTLQVEPARSWLEERELESPIVRVNILHRPFSVEPLPLIVPKDLRFGAHRNSQSALTNDGEVTPAAQLMGSAASLSEIAQAETGQSDRDPMSCDVFEATHLINLSKRRGTDNDTFEIFGDTGRLSFPISSITLGQADDSATTRDSSEAADSVCIASPPQASTRPPTREPYGNFSKMLSVASRRLQQNNTRTADGAYVTDKYHASQHGDLDHSGFSNSFDSDFCCSPESATTAIPGVETVDQLRSLAAQRTVAPPINSELTTGEPDLRDRGAGPSVISWMQSKLASSAQLSPTSQLKLPLDPEGLDTTLKAESSSTGVRFKGSTMALKNSTNGRCPTEAESEPSRCLTSHSFQIRETESGNHADHAGAAMPTCEERLSAPPLVASGNRDWCHLVSQSRVPLSVDELAPTFGHDGGPQWRPSPAHWATSAQSSPSSSCWSFSSVESSTPGAPASSKCTTTPTASNSGHTSLSSASAQQRPGHQRSSLVPFIVEKSRTRQSVVRGGSKWSRLRAAATGCPHTSGLDILRPREDRFCNSGWDSNLVGIGDITVDGCVDVSNCFQSELSVPERISFNSKDTSGLANAEHSSIWFPNRSDTGCGQQVSHYTRTAVDEAAERSNITSRAPRGDFGLKDEPLSPLAHPNGTATRQEETNDGCHKYQRDELSSSEQNVQLLADQLTDECRPPLSLQYGFATAVSLEAGTVQFEDAKLAPNAQHGPSRNLRNGITNTTLQSCHRTLPATQITEIHDETGTRFDHILAENNADLNGGCSWTALGSSPGWRQPVSDPDGNLGRRAAYSRLPRANGFTTAQRIVSTGAGGRVALPAPPPPPNLFIQLGQGGHPPSQLPQGHSSQPPTSRGRQHQQQQQQSRQPHIPRHDNNGPCTSTSGAQQLRHPTHFRAYGQQLSPSGSNYLFNPVDAVPVEIRPPQQYRRTVTRTGAISSFAAAKSPRNSRVSSQSGFLWHLQQQQQQQQQLGSREATTAMGSRSLGRAFAAPCSNWPNGFGTTGRFSVAAPTSLTREIVRRSLDSLYQDRIRPYLVDLLQRVKYVCKCEAAAGMHHSGDRSGTVIGSGSAIGPSTQQNSNDLTNEVPNSKSNEERLAILQQEQNAKIQHANSLDLCELYSFMRSQCVDFVALNAAEVPPSAGAPIPVAFDDGCTATRRLGRPGGAGEAVRTSVVTLPLHLYPSPAFYGLLGQIEARLLDQEDEEVEGGSYSEIPHTRQVVRRADWVELHSMENKYRPEVWHCLFRFLVARLSSAECVRAARESVGNSSTEPPAILTPSSDIVQPPAGIGVGRGLSSDAASSPGRSPDRGKLQRGPSASARSSSTVAPGDSSAPRCGLMPYQFKGGRYGLAVDLQRCEYQPLAALTLGELCHVVQLAIGAGWLAYERSVLQPVAACIELASVLLRLRKHPDEALANGSETSASRSAEPTSSELKRSGCGSSTTVPGNDGHQRQAATTSESPQRVSTRTRSTMGFAVTQTSDRTTTPGPSVATADSSAESASPRHRKEAFQSTAELASHLDIFLQDKPEGFVVAQLKKALVSRFHRDVLPEKFGFRKLTECLMRTPEIARVCRVVCANLSSHRLLLVHQRFLKPGFPTLPIGDPEQGSLSSPDRAETPPHEATQKPLQVETAQSPNQTAFVAAPPAPLLDIPNVMEAIPENDFCRTTFEAWAALQRPVISARYPLLPTSKDVSAARYRKQQLESLRYPITTRPVQHRS